MSDLFHAILRQEYPGYEPEYRFHPERRWKFDHAWPHVKIALEIEGGAWINGRHTRGAGYIRDMEKYSEAAILGWRILRVTPQQVKNGQALELVRRIFIELTAKRAKKWNPNHVKSAAP